MISCIKKSTEKKTRMKEDEEFSQIFYIFYNNYNIYRKKL